jgi:hypothetical protein
MIEMNKEILEIFANDLFNHNVQKDILENVYIITLEKLEDGSLKNFEIKSFMIECYSKFLKGADK